MKKKYLQIFVSYILLERFMRISMWVLYDWLKEYHPGNGITEGRAVLQNVRLFSDRLKFSQNTVYLSPGDEGEVILVNGHDLIYLETGDMNRVFNDILDAFEFYNEWENELTELIQQGAPVEQLLTRSGTVFSEQLLLADASFQVYAHKKAENKIREDHPADHLTEAVTRMPGKDLTEASAGASSIQQAGLPENSEETIMKNTSGEMLSLREMLEINKNDAIRKKGDGPYYVDSFRENEKVLVQNLFQKGRHVGWLIMPGRKAFSEGKMELFSRLGQLVENWMDRDLESSEYRSRTAPFLYILEGNTEKKKYALQSLKTMGWNENDRKQVFVLNPVSSGHGFDDGTGRLFENNFRYSFFFYYENLPVLICNLTLSEEASLYYELNRVLRLTGTIAGQSPEFTDIYSLREQYQAARIAADHGRKLNKIGIVRFSEIVLPYAAYLLKEFSSADIRHPALAVLHQYDQKHHTEFADTLYCFLRYQQSYKDTAEKLSIHRSTLVYRMERILELTKINPEDPDTCLHLLLSYLLEQNG